MVSKNVMNTKMYRALIFVYVSSLFNLYGNFRPIVEICSIGLIGLINFSHRKAVIKSNFYLLWGVVLSILCGFSALYGEDMASSLYGMRGVLECFLAGVIMTNSISSEKDIYRYFRYAVYCACILALRIFLSTPLNNLLNRKFPVNINANAFGLKMALCLLILVFLVKQMMIRWWKIPFFLLIAGTLVSGSKKAIIVAVFGVAILFILFQEQWFKKLVFLFFAVAFVLGIYWLIQNVQFLYDIIGYRVYALVSMLNGTSTGDASSRERVYLIEIALQYWRARPMWGYGINSFGNIVGYSAYGSNNIYSHCNYTELLFGVGLVGTTWYYSLFVYEFQRLCRCIHDNPLSKLLITILITTLLMDIGLVSYGDEFIQFLLAMIAGFCSVYVKKHKFKSNEIA